MRKETQGSKEQPGKRRGGPNAFGFLMMLGVASINPGSEKRGSRIYSAEGGDLEALRRAKARTDRAPFRRTQLERMPSDKTPEEKKDFLDVMEQRHEERRQTLLAQDREEAFLPVEGDQLGTEEG